MVQAPSVADPWPADDSIVVPSDKQEFDAHPSETGSPQFVDNDAQTL